MCLFLRAASLYSCLVAHTLIETLIDDCSFLSLSRLLYLIYACINIMLLNIRLLIGEVAIFVDILNERCWFHKSVYFCNLVRSTSVLCKTFVLSVLQLRFLGCRPV